MKSCTVFLTPGLHLWHPFDQNFLYLVFMRTEIQHQSFSCIWCLQYSPCSLMVSCWYYSLFVSFNKRQQAEGTFSYAFFLQKGLWDFLSLRTLWILKILEDIGRILQRSYQDPHIKSCKIRKPVEKQYVFKSLISLECTFSFVLYSLQNQNND